MTKYQDQVFLNRAVNELKRIEKIYINYLKTANPNEITMESAMLSEERNKLLEDVKSHAT